MSDIVRDDNIRSGEPGVDGPEITVFDLKRRVIDRSDDPPVVAGEHGISLADLVTAPAHYYDDRGCSRPASAMLRQPAAAVSDGPAPR